uniref:SUEL-type lectin domain-containing protein n=4 Tax=Magallana gigas TaxID=29159 RepID=A0A8W8JVI8_MAGGI
MWKCLVLIAVFLVFLQGKETEGWCGRPPGYAHSKTVCEHKQLHLRCGRHRRIHVVSAIYGRTNRHTCGHGRVGTTSCKARHASFKVKRRCNGKRSCRIRASNGVFGDPCVGTFKYLKVRYQCKRPRYTHSKTVCEHNRLHLRCGRHRRIHVVSAMYGRTNRHTCGHGPIGTTSCKAGHASFKVKRKCNGKRSCRIRASNGVFGDPCVGTFKYLKVRYQCKRNHRG